MNRIRRLDINQKRFFELLKETLDRNIKNEKNVSDSVAQIIRDVKINGDSAVLLYTKKFDQCDVKNVADLELVDFKKSLDFRVSTA